MKKLILVTSPPACGKTFISKELSKALKHVVYLDKDTLIGLSKQIFKVANQEYNRSSDFFQENIRNYEYQVIVDIALEALDYDDTVLINAPFSQEIRNKEFIVELTNKLAVKNAALAVIWVETDTEVAHKRMIERNSDRDTWKLQNWDKYISTINYERPNLIENLIIFRNSSDEEFQISLKETVELLSK